MPSIANEIAEFERPFKKPYLIIIGGETTVTLIGKEKGYGGRNQELCLAAALKLKPDKKITVLCLGTDGTDGPTKYAGGIVDQTTAQYASKLGIDLELELKRHNSSKVLSKLNGAILTDNTGTNLVNIILICID